MDGLKIPEPCSYCKFGLRHVFFVPGLKITPANDLLPRTLSHALVTRLGFGEAFPQSGKGDLYEHDLDSRGSSATLRPGVYLSCSGRILTSTSRQRPVAGPGTERHWRQHEHYEFPRKREFFAA